jgi:hypothetical protein
VDGECWTYHLIYGALESKTLDLLPLDLVQDRRFCNYFEQSLKLNAIGAKLSRLRVIFPIQDYIDCISNQQKQSKTKQSGPFLSKRVYNQRAQKQTNRNPNSDFDHAISNIKYNGIKICRRRDSNLEGASALSFKQ